VSTNQLKPNLLGACFSLPLIHENNKRKREKASQFGMLTHIYVK